MTCRGSVVQVHLSSPRKRQFSSENCRFIFACFHTFSCGTKHPAQPFMARSGVSLSCAFLHSFYSTKHTRPCFFLKVGCFTIGTFVLVIFFRNAKRCAAFCAKPVFITNKLSCVYFSSPRVSLPVLRIFTSTEIVVSKCFLSAASSGNSALYAVGDESHLRRSNRQMSQLLR